MSDGAAPPPEGGEGAAFRLEGYGVDDSQVLRYFDGGILRRPALRNYFTRELARRGVGHLHGVGDLGAEEQPGGVGRGADAPAEREPGAGQGAGTARLPAGVEAPAPEPHGGAAGGQQPDGQVRDPQPQPPAERVRGEDARAGRGGGELAQAAAALSAGAERDQGAVQGAAQRPQPGGRGVLRRGLPGELLGICGVLRAGVPDGGRRAAGVGGVGRAQAVLAGGAAAVPAVVLRRHGAGGVPEDADDLPGRGVLLHRAGVRADGERRPRAGVPAGGPQPRRV
ncbi:uncharacterized protein BcabD6B2_39820 [Babesia caballi]|uniref:Uncharacterized protein n=1 Tax=Babesia caballi TaxID=5871 RepID=A0AAV4LXM1_BABCB|nr:hypothetical protein, conserved [Babesia caballi]